MAGESIVIKISKDGEMTVGAKGIKGMDCKKLTAEIEKQLGDVVSDKNTSEYYEQNDNTLGVSNHG